MNEDEESAAVTTEKQRTAFVAQLDKAEEWLYEGGEGAAAKEHRWGHACVTEYDRSPFASLLVLLAHRLAQRLASFV